MSEQIARASHYFEIHLLSASVVWLAAWVLTSIRGGTATTKYWIWVATSLNFVLPLSPVLDAFWPAHPSWITTLDAIGAVGNGISRNAPAIAALWVVWLLGTLLMLIRLGLRIQADRRHAKTRAVQSAHASRPGFLAHGVPVSFAGSQQAPAVDGVLRPHISLPDGIGRLLNEQELNAVLIHELTHARRGDNFIRLMHEVGLCALWFHPLAWITGSRLALYRELSCDESVIRSAHGGDLVSALAKLANAENGPLLQATASSFMTDRLARLTAAEPQRPRLASNALLAALFGLVLLAGVFGTAAQTAGISRFAVFANAPCPLDRLSEGPTGVFSLPSARAHSGAPESGIRIDRGVKAGIPEGVSGSVSSGVKARSDQRRGRS
jgi:beta-lactamase regulating signal transducer with metallopeptidase domain